MKEQMLYRDKAHLYDLIYSDKDYKKDALAIRKVINAHKKSEGKDLLEVACGTGSYLTYLKKHFNCTGTDVNQKVLDIAKKKHPNISFKKQNMAALHLNKKFDIIVCLFSSIGYLKTKTELKKAFKCFEANLKEGGVLIIEPWFTKETYHRGHAHMSTYEDENFKLCRMNVSRRRGDLSVLDFHWLVGVKDKSVEHFSETHEMRMTSHKELVTLAQAAKLKAKMQTQNYTNRKLLVAVKE